MKQLIFLGHATNIERYIDIAILNYEILGIVDSNYYGNTEILNNLPIIGSEDQLSEVLTKFPEAVFFIVPSLRNTIDWSCTNSKRIKMIDAAEAHQLPLTNLIHPTAIIPSTTRLGNSIYIGEYTVLHNHVSIEDYVCIRSQVCVAHDSIIKKNVLLSTQCYVGSTVIVGENSYIGIKSSLIGGVDLINNVLTIGSNCFTQPNSVVIKNLPNGSTATISGKIRKPVDK